MLQVDASLTTVYLHAVRLLCCLFTAQRHRSFFTETESKKIWDTGAGKLSRKYALELNNCVVFSVAMIFTKRLASVGDFLCILNTVNVSELIDVPGCILISLTHICSPGFVYLLHHNVTADGTTHLLKNETSFLNIESFELQQKLLYLNYIYPLDFVVPNAGLPKLVNYLYNNIHQHADCENQNIYS